MRFDAPCPRFDQCLCKGISSRERESFLQKAGSSAFFFFSPSVISADSAIDIDRLLMLVTTHSCSIPRLPRLFDKPAFSMLDHSNCGKIQLVV